MCQGTHVEARGQMQELVFSSHFMDPQDQTQFIWLGGKFLNPLSYLWPTLALLKSTN